MSVIKHGPKLLFVRLEVEPQEIPDLLNAHSKKWEPPGRLEALAGDLCARDFPDAPSAEFAEEVVKWGRGQRFVGRFREKNTDQQIASALRRAGSLAQDDQITLAVSEVQQLKHLGQSFASKLVRFICPQRAVILDEVIRGALGYRDSPEGYGEFLSDCHIVLDAARDFFPDLRICDVEAAIFAKLQGY